MGKKVKKRKKKINRVRQGYYGRLFIICLEIFALVSIVGVSLVLLKADEQKQVAKQLKDAGVTEELLIGTNVSEKAQDHNAVAEDSDTSRYGAELADEEYCKENRIYSMPTISADEIVLTFAGDVSFAEGYANIGALRQRENGILC